MVTAKVPRAVERLGVDCVTQGCALLARRLRIRTAELAIDVDPADGAAAGPVAEPGQFHSGTHWRKNTLGHSGIRAEKVVLDAPPYIRVATGMKSGKAMKFFRLSY